MTWFQLMLGSAPGGRMMGGGAATLEKAPVSQYGADLKHEPA